MKKIALFALAALCVSAAQAVTVGWTANVTSNGTNPNDFPGWYGIVILAGEQSVTTAALCATAAPHEGDKTFTITGYDEEDVLGQTLYTNAQTGDLSVPAAAFGSVEIDGLDAITLVIFNKSWNKASSYVMDVTELAEGDWANFGLVNFEKQEVVTVPEPTALALLALGVAGLALKRKHA